MVALEHIAASSIADEETLANDAPFLFSQPSPIPLLSHYNLDAASVLAAHMLAVKPNDRVLDLCAAPGGKSIALAQLIFNTNDLSSSLPSGCLRANEPHPTSNKRLTANLHAYLPSPLFTSRQICIFDIDATNRNAVQQLPYGDAGYDRVLVDAPCSSERYVIHAHTKATASAGIAHEMRHWLRTHRKGWPRHKSVL